MPNWMLWRKSTVAKLRVQLLISITRFACVFWQPRILLKVAALIFIMYRWDTDYHNSLGEDGFSLMRAVSVHRGRQCWWWCRLVHCAFDSVAVKVTFFIFHIFMSGSCQRRFVWLSTRYLGKLKCQILPFVCFTGNPRAHWNRSRMYQQSDETQSEKEP